MIHGSCLISFMAMMALRIDPPTLQQRSNMQRPGIQSWNRSCITPILRVESLADFIATVTVLPQNVKHCFGFAARTLLRRLARS